MKDHYLPQSEYQNTNKDECHEKSGNEKYTVATSISEKPGHESKKKMCSHEQIFSKCQQYGKKNPSERF